jgi:hypothetical protein
MTAERCTTPEPVRGADPPRTGPGPWLRLAAGIGLILAFIFGAGRLAQEIPGARRMAQVIEARNLRATAIYYTDFEEPAEASQRIGDSLDYRPRGAP